MAFTGGTSPEPVVDEQVTGATSGSTAKISAITLTSGSWAAGTAAGTMYFYGRSAAFVSEQVDCAGGGHFHITADFTYSAWKTLYNGATAARLTADDTIRVRKSDAPISIGNATWTDQSRTVTLDAARTKDIDGCETAWTAAAGGDTTVARLNTSTYLRQGSYYMRFTLDSSPQTSRLQAYFPLASTQDFSAYQEISFWLYNSAVIAANQWRIALCSDAAGATVVDWFEVPAIPYSGRMRAFVVAKTGGGNLGSSINSIALYTGTSAPNASSQIYLDCIIATKSNDLNLLSILTKEGGEARDSSHDGYYTIMCISGATVTLANSPLEGLNSSTHYGYSGTTENVATYIRPFLDWGIQQGVTSTTHLFYFTTQKQVTIIGGWNIMTNEMDGDTVFNADGGGYFVTGSGSDYVTLQNFAFVRIGYGLSIGGLSPVYRNIMMVCCQYGFYGSGWYPTIEDAVVLNSPQAINPTQMMEWNIKTYEARNCTAGLTLSVGSYGLTLRGGVLKFRNCAAAISVSTCSREDVHIRRVEMKDCLTGFSGTHGFSIHIHELIEDNVTTPFSWSNAGDVGKVYIDKYDQNSDLAYIGSSNLGFIKQQAASVGGTGYEWLFSMANNLGNYTFDIKLFMRLAKILVNADAQVTVSVYGYMKDANIKGGLWIPPHQLAGVDEMNAESTLSATREQITLSFTPTEAGVIEIYLYAYGGQYKTAIFDDFDATQA